VDLSLRVIGNDTPEEPQVRLIHADDPVESVIIGPDKLPGPFVSIESYPMLGQATLCRRINWIANLLRRHGRRFYIILGIKPFGLNQRLEYKLCHRTPANVSVADK
jgi:hypothetical protein